MPDQAFGVALRSPHAHARIVSIDATRARAMPGVRLVLTGADVVAEGLNPVPYDPHPASPPDIHLDNLDGSLALIELPHPLAVDTARYAGEAVAFVVADSEAQGRDAAAAIVVAYESLPPIGDIAVDARVGNPRATRAGFAEAPHVVRLETVIERRMTGVVLSSESALLDWASTKLGAPVHWSGERLAYASGGIAVEAELAVAQDGKFLGLHASLTADLGAYTASFVPLSRAAALLTSLYDLPASVRARGVLSNSVNTGSGDPGTMVVIERLIDRAALEAGFDRLALRRQNLIRKTPHRNACGVALDHGDCLATFDEAIRLAGHPDPEIVAAIDAQTRLNDQGWRVGTYPYRWLVAERG